MKKTFTRLVFLLLPALALEAQAQSGSISGKLLEPASKSAVGFASVGLFAAKDSSVVTGVTSDEAGKFLLEKLPYGQYYVKINLVGFAPKILSNLSLTETQPKLDLGTIMVSSGTKKLSEVEIVAQKNLIEYGLDKQVINVAKDLSSVGGTAADALKNSPSVSVDIDNNVSVRGSSNVTVLVNGKNSGQSAQSILSQTPASAIEKIEVITNPSAKYDAEGMGGIINIVLKQDAKPGFNGNVALNLGTYDNHNASLGLNYRIGKFNFFGNYDYMQQYRRGNFDLDRRTTTKNPNTGIESSNFQDQDQTGRKLIQTNIPKIGFDYQLTDKQTLTFSAKSFRMDNDDKETVRNMNVPIQSLTDHTETGPRLYYTSLGHTINQFRSTDYAFSYRKSFENKRKELTASAVYTSMNGSFDRNFNRFSTDQVLVPNGWEQQQKFLQEFNVKPLFLQADYVHPVGEKGKVETGAKHSQKRLSTSFLAENFDYNTGAFVYDPGISNRFGYEEFISAAYANYSNSWKKLSYQVGLRSEKTDITAHDKGTDVKKGNHYLNFFPSAFITYDVNENRKVQLNYSRRLNRPNYEALNPFVNKTDPQNIWYGNPLLLPEYINAYEGSFIQFWKTGSLTSTGFYRQVDNLIQQVRTVDADDPKIAYNTYVNLDNAQSYGLEISGTQSVMRFIRLSGNVSGFNYQVNGKALGVNANSNSFSWSSRLNANIMAPKGLSAQLSFNYKSPQAQAQGTRAAIYNTDLSLKKDVLKKKSSVTLRVSDVFNTLRWDTYVSSPDLIYDLHTKRQSRIVTLGLTYRFGNEQEKRRRPETGTSLEGMF
jgi:outer membrane receptor protein involved in Fe transport